MPVRTVSTMVISAMLLLGGCPPESADLLDAVDGLLPDDAAVDGGLGPDADPPADNDSPVTIQDLLDGLGDAPPQANADPNEPNEPGGDDEPSDEEDDLDEDGDEEPGDEEGDEDDADDSADDGEDGNDEGDDADEGDADPNEPADDDGNDDGDADPNEPADDDGDDGETDPNEPADGDDGDDEDTPPASELTGTLDGDVTCQIWQFVEADPNDLEDPEDDPAITNVNVMLEFATVGQPDGVWIPGFIDSNDQFAAITEVGETAVINDAYNAMTMVTRIEVVEAEYGPELARTVVDITQRFRDPEGILLIRATGRLTQEIEGLEAGGAAFRSNVQYDATMWTPDHLIELETTEIYDCDGVLD